MGLLICVISTLFHFLLLYPYPHLQAIPRVSVWSSMQQKGERHLGYNLLINAHDHLQYLPAPNDIVERSRKIESELKWLALEKDAAIFG